MTELCDAKAESSHSLSAAHSKGAGPWVPQPRCYTMGWNPFLKTWISNNIYYIILAEWVSQRMFLEHRNRQKILSNIRQHFSCLLDEWIAKKCKKKSRCFFFKSALSVLRCSWTGRINLKIFFGYDVNYLSIQPFMRHPWFPTRKASKATFVSFQLAGKPTFDYFQLAGCCHWDLLTFRTTVQYL